MKRVFTFIVNLGAIGLWYGTLVLVPRIMEPQLDHQRYLFKGLGAQLPVITQLWINMNALHCPLGIATVAVIVSIAVETRRLSPETRDLWHTLVHAGLLLYLVFTIIAIAMPGAVAIEGLSLKPRG